MLKTLEEAPMPATSGELSELIGRTFRDLTGFDLTSARDRFHLEKYEGPGVGMSKGMISVNFWREQALPLLIERLPVESGGPQ